MLKLNEFLYELERFAPLEISQLCIKNGGYDNSGILVRCTENASNVLFTLDLSNESVALAKRLKCDTIVTHHPAIYKPLSSLSTESVITSAITQAIKANLNVISMHLNLDMTECGIDYYLALGLGAKSSVILDQLDKKRGYGRLCEIAPVSFSEFVKNAKDVFDTDKIITYGKKSDEIKKFASFCGAGAGDALKFLEEGKLGCDLIVTSDMPHHTIFALIEKGYKVMLLTHYAAEDYGFNKFYKSVTNSLESKVITHYFSDKRFK